MSKPKPKKISFTKYYIKDGLFAAVATYARKIWRKIIGGWYCDHCEKHHGRRVVKYRRTLCFTTYHCSLGVETADEEAMKNSPAQDLLDAKAKWEAQLKHVDTSSISSASNSLQKVADATQQYKDLAT